MVHAGTDNARKILDGARCLFCSRPLLWLVASNEGGSPRQQALVAVEYRIAPKWYALLSDSKQTNISTRVDTELKKWSKPAVLGYEIFLDCGPGKVQHE